MVAAQENSPTVVIAGDKSKATLRIPPGCNRAMLTKPLLIGLISGEGVEVTDHTASVIQAFVKDPPPEDQEVTLEVAFATPVMHGSDGSILWCVDEAKESEDGAEGDAAEDSTVSHYNRCSFNMVQTGDVIGKVRTAELGQDGRDVTGATIPAKPGKDVKLTIDESIMMRADGSLIAQQDGVLYHEAGKAQIRKHIEIRDYVDFSTGNIDFDGDITIDRGVRDCFEVTATGKIEVKGMIEAAIIRAGKDLVAFGGFAGRERGHAYTGGCLRGKYLDNVYGKVKQDLCIDREVINCELMIDRKIVSPHGSIIGGRISPTGEVEIGTLGSGAGVTTELVIGTVPSLEPFARKLDRIFQILTRDIDKLNNEQDIINKNSAKGRMTATDKERQTEIMFEQSMIGSSLDRAQRTLDRINQRINKRRRVDVTIQRVVHPGVTFILDERCYKMLEEIAGPIRFFMNGKEFVCRVGDAPAQPVSQIADVRAVRPSREAA
jgi:uncharacterized protein